MANGMNVLDIVALAIIILSVLSGISKGLAVELSSLVSVFAGLLLAAFYYDRLQGFFAKAASPAQSGFFAFVAIFVAVIVGGMLIGFLLDRFLRSVRLKGMDRLLGAFFGVFRGWLVVSVIFLAFTAFSVQRENVANSRTAPFFMNSARLVIVLVPQELKDRFADGYKRIYELWIGREK